MNWAETIVQALKDWDTSLIAYVPDISIDQVSHWLSTEPANFIGLGHRKGKIKIGYDADLVIFDPHASFSLENKMIHHKHKLTPFEGRKFYGKVLATFLGGEKIFTCNSNDESSFSNHPQGNLLKRGEI